MGELYAMLATATGWTFGEIGDHTLWDVRHLLRYWRVHPPTHVTMRVMQRMLTVWMGGKDEAPAPVKYATAQDAEAIVAMFK